MKVDCDIVFPVARTNCGYTLSKKHSFLVLIDLQDKPPPYRATKTFNELS